MPINSFLYPATQVVSGYEVANSLRFDSGSSPKLVKSQTTATNRKKWTWSGWIKAKSTNSADSHIFAFGDSNSQSVSYIGNDQILRFYEHDGSSASVILYTNRVLRDPSAWYHIMYAFDSTQSTESDRLKLYINGVQETSFSSTTYPSLNQDSNIGINGEDAKIGTRIDGTGGYFDGYMTEVVFIDGTAYDQTSFGEFDEDSGIWKPIDVSGLTFGNNGFYLDFEDSSNLGNDANGGTDFTETNITSIDQSTDTCTNNFATMNPLANYYASHTFSEGNLKIVGNSSTARYSVSTIGVSSGKWYFEGKLTNFTTNPRFIIGIESTIGDYPLGNQASGYGYWQDGQKLNSGSTSSFGNSYTTNDIIGVAVDMDNRYIYFSKNGTWQNSGDPTSGSSGTGSAFNFSVADQYFMAVGETGSTETATWELNFGSPPFSITSGNSDGNGYGNFEYSVPSGYYALNTKNLAEYG